jgi:tRNA-specific 2-thiouridylase
MGNKRVVVAMSGGVDSSLATALLKEADYEVIGVTMQIWPREASESEKFGGCCGVEAVDAAKQVAYKLGIPHYVMDLRDIFAQKVIADFCQEYSLGRTPNPCIRCNQYVKFEALLQRAKELDADLLATGHYARIHQSTNGYRLLKAADPNKDQSYFLYTLGQRELQHLLFPVGNLHKLEVRKLATKLGLPTANRPDSQDVCFIPDNDYRPFIAKHVPLEPGDIVESKGRILGKHRGLAQYTVGQRHGLGLASNQPRYVLKLDTATNRLVVGTKGQLLSNRLLASQLSWVSGKVPQEANNITAKIRYKSPEAATKLYPRNGTVEVHFYQPQWAIAPGQAVVFYQGEVVLGGGVIEDRLD